jgi:hypothetical protein
MFLCLKAFIATLMILCVFFTSMGIYTLDAILIIIGFLFAVAVLLTVLEAQDQSKNPFKKR